jgi:SagB-type dehydrogenase family enzyme
MNANRDLLKSEFAGLETFQSDQARGKPNPPLQKPPADGAELIDLPDIDGTVELPSRDVFDVVAARRSRRRYTDESIRQQQLAYLLWATAGVHRVVGDGYVTMRTVPSAGARHPFETYLLVQRVEGLASGVYHYLPLSHQLELVRRAEDTLMQQAAGAALNQPFLAASAVTFVWAAIPYRCEWRYGPVSPKAMLLDAGHIAQNLYLAAESAGLGTCAIAAYDQQQFDQLLGLDGQEEFTVYLAPVGPLKG